MLSIRAIINKTYKYTVLLLKKIISIYLNELLILIFSTGGSLAISKKRLCFYCLRSLVSNVSEIIIFVEILPLEIEASKRI